MTKEQLKQYTELNKQFEKDCQYVRDILENYACFKEEDNISHANNFQLCCNGEEVYWDGGVFYGGDFETHSGFFPSEYLTMTIEELNNAATQKNNEYLEEKHRRRLEREEKQRNADYIKYCELKKKFEG